jgi:hypothetical protein
VSAPFQSHSEAALALLTSGTELRQKEGQFLGGIAFTETLTDKQLNWLIILLSRHGLPPLAEALG